MTRIRWAAAIGTAALAAAVAGVVRFGHRDDGADLARLPAAHADESARGAPSTDAPADPWARRDTSPQPPILYTKFETLTEGLPSPRTTCVVAEAGEGGADDLFVGTEEGFAERRGGTWRTWGESDGIPHRFITSVARDAAADVTWVATLRGLARIAGGTVEAFTQRSSGLTNDVVYHVVVEGPRVWCGTASGTAILDTRTGSWSSFDHENSIMHEPWSYALAHGPERAWVAIWGGGVVELDRRRGTWREYVDPDREMEIDLLPDDGPIHDVSSFVAYGDALLWQSTYFGLSRYDGRRWTTYTAKDQGIPGDFITQVAARGDACWIASDQGFGVVQGDRVLAYTRAPDGTGVLRVSRGGKLEETRKLASAPADDVVQWTFPRERDVWIATARGLSRGIQED